jgi:hypothetical protein
MKKLFVAPCTMLLVVAQFAATAGAADVLDLRRGVPDDVYMVVEARNNPERDYQKVYYEDIWNTVQETKIIDRALKIITSRLEEDQLEQASSVIDELREAAKPIDLEALMNCKQMIFAQKMNMSPLPSSQHLVLMRVTPEAAASTVEGVKNLFAMAAKYTDGTMSVDISEIGDAQVVTLALPQQSPMQPAMANIGDVVIFSSSHELLKTSLDMMTSGQGTSKFDDARLAAALSKLPEAEDSLVFFDGRALFDSMREIVPFIAGMGGGDPNVTRVVKYMEMIFDEVSIFDYEVTVEYTEGNLNRTASYGKLMPDAQKSTLYQVTSSGTPFEEWQAWVPAGALSYSLGTGANLHPIYERVMSILKEDVPEAAEGLEKFEQIQQHFDVYLDRDILQAFSGEYASVTMPSESGTPDSVLALRCQKPDRIRELMHRGMDALAEIEQVKAVQLKLTESTELEGFDQLSALPLMMAGVQPVIGFKDGWMYIGSKAGAVKKVFEVQAGDLETVKDTDAFTRLSMEVEGPVDAIKYANTAEGTRNFADMLTKVGTMAPMIIGMVSANAGADAESLKPVQEAMALLPDLAKIVRKFDFLEAKMTVVQDGDELGTYNKRTVTVVRTPDAENN